MNYKGNGYEMEDGKIFIDSEYFIRYMRQAMSTIQSGMFFRKKNDIIDDIEQNDRIFIKLKQTTDSSYDLYESQMKIISGSTNMTKSDRNDYPTLQHSWKDYIECQQKCDDYIRNYFESNPIKIDEDEVWKDFKDMTIYDGDFFNYEMYRGKLSPNGIESSDYDNNNWYQI